MKLSKGMQFFAGSTQTTYDLTNLNLSAGTYAITVVAEAEGFTDSDASNSVNYTVQAQLATPTIAMNADGKTLEITDVADATSYDVYVDGTLKTNVAKAPSGYQVTLYAHGHTWRSQYAAPRLKLDAAPTSADDYDYTMTTDDTKHILNKAGDDLGTSVNIGAHTIVYVFSSNASASVAYAEYSDQIFGSGKNYNNADIITLDGMSDRIYLYSEGQD